MPQSYGPGGLSADHRRIDLTLEGHIIDIFIRSPDGVPQLSGTKPFCETRGLIDTGASDVCIDFRLAQDLGLKAIDQRDVGVVGATVPATIYLGILEIPALKFHQLMPLYALKVRRPTHEVLLGRSFLQHFIVTFDGPNGTFHFASPSDALQPHAFDE